MTVRRITGLPKTDPARPAGPSSCLAGRAVRVAAVRSSRVEMTSRTPAAEHADRRRGPRAGENSDPLIDAHRQCRQSPRLAKAGRAVSVAGVPPPPEPAGPTAGVARRGQVRHPPLVAHRQCRRFTAPAKAGRAVSVAVTRASRGDVENPRHSAGCLVDYFCTLFSTT